MFDRKSINILKTLNIVIYFGAWMTNGSSSILSQYFHIVPNAGVCWKEPAKIKIDECEMPWAEKRTNQLNNLTQLKMKNTTHQIVIKISKFFDQVMSRDGLERLPTRYIDLNKVNRKQLTLFTRKAGNTELWKIKANKFLCSIMSIIYTALLYDSVYILTYLQIIPPPLNRRANFFKFWSFVKRTVALTVIHREYCMPLNIWWLSEYMRDNQNRFIANCRQHV